MRWTEENVEPGTIVAKQWSDNSRFYTPLILAYRHEKCRTIYGAVSLRDGSFMEFGDGTAAGLAKTLNEGGYVPCMKIKFKNVGDISTIENRTHVPVLVIHNAAD